MAVIDDIAMVEGGDRRRLGGRRLLVVSEGLSGMERVVGRSSVKRQVADRRFNDYPVRQRSVEEGCGSRSSARK